LTAQDANDVVVLRFSDRGVPRALAELPVAAPSTPADIDASLDARRVVVLGADADLAAVLSRLLRADRLDVEVAYPRRRRSAATRAYGIATGLGAARRAVTGSPARVPLVRDETGRVLVGAALWVGEAELERGAKPAQLHGEAVADDTVLFDGFVAAVRIEPTRTLPGVRASVLTGRMRPRRWVSGRAVQLGSTGAFVVRDGEPSTRPVRRSTFYRNTQGWLLVG
jgi:hypothetical protein